MMMTLFGCNDTVSNVTHTIKMFILVSVELCKPSSSSVITVLTITCRRQESKTTAVSKKGTCQYALLALRALLGPRDL